MSASNDLVWWDCTACDFVQAKVNPGGGGWPPMVSLDINIDSSLISADVRALAEMLVRAADACDEQNRIERERYA